MPAGSPGKKTKAVIAVSGGADSVYLLRRVHPSEDEVLIGHVNYGARGRESDEDMRSVERMAEELGLPVRVKRLRGKGEARISGPGFEEKARRARYDFLREVKKESGAQRILLAHTADDQVETVLMRILEGAGISGLKGIPRKSADGVERPLLDTWREDILRYLRRHRIPYRVDTSNFDTRFERNWIRHVLVPLLEKRYGKSVKKRIYALGERFREIDEFLEAAARRWMGRNVTGGRAGPRASSPQRAKPGRTTGGEPVRIQRKRYAARPSALRVKILQLLCFERIGVAPNERLLGSMDRLVVSGGASSRLKIGKGAVLRIRYGEAILEGGTQGESAASGAGGNRRAPSRVLDVEQRGKLAPAALKKMTKGETGAVFDADALSAPVSMRALRAGDRIRPFGLDAEKKVKEILIDRKVPREERWGRPVVCDANGTILWIPGVVRSAHAPVTGATRRTLVLRAAIGAADGP